MDWNHPSLDHATLQWLRDLPGMLHEFFHHRYAADLAQIEWQVDSILEWLPVWTGHIGTLCWEEWVRLDADLQRLYLLLDYERAGRTSDGSSPHPPLAVVHQNSVQQQVQPVSRQTAGLLPQPAVDRHRPDPRRGILMAPFFFPVGERRGEKKEGTTTCPTP